MCLITPITNPFVLDKDYYVFKEIYANSEGTHAESIYQSGFTYKKGEILKTEFGFTTCYSIYDEQAHLRNLPNDFSDPDVLRAMVVDGSIKSIAAGFHFAVNMRRIELRRRSVMPNISLEMALFMVPAGSTVYIDNSGLGVANGIRFDRVIDINNFDSKGIEILGDSKLYKDHLRENQPK